MTESTSPVTIGWYLHPLEAEIARGRLEAEGIPAFLHSAGHSTVNWPITLAIGGIRLQVPPSAVEEARQVLEEAAPLDPEPGDTACPKCGSQRIESLRVTWKMSMFSSHIFGIPLPFSQSSVRCASCGNVWNE